MKSTTSTPSHHPVGIEGRPTNQKIFDRVAVHLITQGKKAHAKDEDGHDVCQYRRGSKSCAVGCLIPDAIYHKGLEGHPVDRLGAYAPANTPVTRHAGVQAWAGGLKRHMSLLRSLQVVHDYTDPKEWPTKLGVVARKFRLSTAVLDT